MLEFTLAKDIGNNIKHRLEEMKMTQTELSIQTKIPLSTMSKYINGERLPSFKHLQNICYILKCSYTNIAFADEIIH
jgi:transcriptional regulator with XRE-family HTH domain